ncbi:MAG: LysR substrate-binding domain-containing protein [Alcaligenaceae bacterium]|nr:LysR substrate-binding domain-containing protein [Alcaligenaceae bacterium]
MKRFDAEQVARRLTSRLRIRHLALLLRIQEYGSLTRVAEAMATSQPAVTKALLELEDIFGAQLFERSVRGMAPTALGRLAIARAEAIIHDLEHLARDMEAGLSGYAAHLHIGVVPFVSGKLLSAAIRRSFPEGGKRLTVTIHEGPSDQLLQQLRDHTLDLVVGQASAEADTRELAFEVLYSQQPRLIASRRLAAQLTRHKLDWGRLNDLDWILGAPQTSIRDQVSALFLGAGLTPPAPIVESHSSKLIGEMIVDSDSAVSIVPADIADELVRVAGVAIVPYRFSWSLPPVALFSRAEGRKREAEAMFGRALHQVCRQTASYPLP